MSALLCYLSTYLSLHCIAWDAMPWPQPHRRVVPAAGPYAATDAPTGLAVRCTCACAAVTRACRRPPGEWEEQAGRKARDDRLCCIDRRSVKLQPVSTWGLYLRRVVARGIEAAGSVEMEARA